LLVTTLADDIIAMGPLAEGTDDLVWSYRDGVWSRTGTWYATGPPNCSGKRTGGLTAATLKTSSDPGLEVKHVWEPVLGGRPVVVPFQVL
jgi:hypothetical protein